MVKLMLLLSRLLVKGSKFRDILPLKSLIMALSQILKLSHITEKGLQLPLLSLELDLQRRQMLNQISMNL